MKVQLNESLRVEISPIQGRLICRVFHGDQEKPASPELLHAVGSLIAGQRTQDAINTLRNAGILTEQQSLPTLQPDSHLSLKGSVALNIRLRPATGQQAGPNGPRFVEVLPENSLPIGLFLPPAALSSIQQVDDALKTAWFAMLRSAQSQRRVLEPKDAQRVLARVVDHHLATDPTLGQLFQWANPRKTALKQKSPLQTDQWQYPIERIQILADRNTSPRNSNDQLLYHLGGNPKKIAAFGALLGLLSKGCTLQEVNELLEQIRQPSLNQLFLDLVRKNWLTTDSSSPIEMAPGEVIHLGHASLLARLGDEHILIDPWFIPASASDENPPIGLASLPPIRAVFITHHHWDHVNIETLIKLDKNIPIYIPRQSTLKPLVPKTMALLNALGFESVRSMSHGDGIDFGPNGRVVAAPFFGEDPTQLEYGANTYVLVHEEQAAFVHVDSGTNLNGESIVTTGHCAQLVEQFGPLNPIFATRRQERGTMIEHTWEYLLQPTGSWVAPTENCCNSAAFLAQLCEAGQSEHLVLYSEGGASYYPIGTDFLRGDTPKALDEAYEFGWDSVDTIREVISAETTQIHRATPGQRYQIGRGLAQ